MSFRFEGMNEPWFTLLLFGIAKPSPQGRVLLCSSLYKRNSERNFDRNAEP